MGPCGGLALSLSKVSGEGLRVEQTVWLAFEKLPARAYFCAKTSNCLVLRVVAVCGACVSLDALLHALLIVHALLHALLIVHILALTFSLFLWLLLALMLVRLLALLFVLMFAHMGATLLMLARRFSSTLMLFELVLSLRIIPDIAAAPIVCSQWCNGLP